MNIYKITHREHPDLYCLESKRYKCYVLAEDFKDVEIIFKTKYPNNEIINIEFKIDIEVLYEQF